MFSPSEENLTSSPIRQRGPPQLLFWRINSKQRRGGGSWTVCVCARTSTCEGVYLLWAGLGTAQNRCPGSNPISPQPGKSPTAAQWAAARGCGQLDPMPCHFHSFAANSFTSSFVHFWSVRFHMQWSPQSADTVSARTKHKHEKLDFGDLIQHYVTGYPVVVSPLNLKVQLLERSSRPAPRTKAQMEKKMILAAELLPNSVSVGSRLRLPQTNWDSL